MEKMSKEILTKRIFVGIRGRTVLKKIKEDMERWSKMGFREIGAGTFKKVRGLHWIKRIRIMWYIGSSILLMDIQICCKPVRSLGGLAVDGRISFIII